MLNKKPFKVLSTGTLAAVFAASALVPTAAFAAEATQSVDQIVIEKDGKQYKFTTESYRAALLEGFVTSTDVGHVGASNGKFYTVGDYQSALLENGGSVSASLQALEAANMDKNIAPVEGQFDGNGNIVPAPTETKLKVESVTAINKTDVTVTLDEAPQEAPTSEDFNLTVNGEKLAVNSVSKVQSDLTGKTFKLSFASLNGKEGSLAVNGTDAKIATGQVYAFDFKDPESTGVTVIDKNTIQVNFGEKLASSAANNGFFTVAKVSGAVNVDSNAVLSADGKSVTLTLADPLTVADYIVTLTDGITDVKGNKVINNTEVAFKPKASELADIAAPKFVKAAYNTVTGTVDVDFNKNVSAVDAAKFSINDVAFTSNDTVTVNNTKISIKLSNATKEAVNALTGDLTLTAAKDAFATLDGSVKTAGESVKVATQAPALVSSAAYNQETDLLTVKFDKPVTLEGAVGDTAVTVSDGSAAPVAITVGKAVKADGTAGVNPKTASDTWTFKEPNLESGRTVANLKVFIAAGAVKNEASVINSATQNTYANGVKVTYTADEVKPTLASAEYNNNTGDLTLTFSEDINAATATLANMKLWTADGTALTGLANLNGKTIDPAAGSSKTLKVTSLTNAEKAALTLAFDTGKNIKVTLDANTVTDNSNNKNDATNYATGAAVVYKDYKAPGLAAGAPINVVNKNLVTVKFNEPLDPATAQNVENYVIKDSTGQQLTVTKASLQAVDQTDGSQIVSLVTADQVANAPYTISIKDVKDKALNTITTAVTGSFNGSATAAEAKLTVDTLTVTSNKNAKDKLAVKFNTALDVDSATALANYAVLESDNQNDWTAAKAVSLTNSTVKTTAADQVEITLDAYKLQTGKYYKVVVGNVTTVNGSALGTADGDKDAVSALTAFAPVEAPTITQTNKTTGSVKLVYKEALNKAAAETASNYTVGTTVAKKATYTWDDAKKEATVVLDVDPALTAPANVTVDAKVTNLAGVSVPNTVNAPGSLTDATKPEVSVVSGTTVSGLDNDVVTVKFNELVRPADATNAANYTIGLADGSTVKVVDLKANGTNAPKLEYDGAGTVTITLDNSGTGNNGKKYNLKNGEQVSVAVSNVRDLAGNVIDTVTKSGTIAGDTVKPDFSGANAELTGTYTIAVGLTEEVDASTVTKEDFKLTENLSGNVINITSVEVSGDLKTITLTSSTPLSAGTVYKVEGSDTASIKDLAGNEAKKADLTAKTTQAVVVGAPTAAAVKDSVENTAGHISNASKSNATVTVTVPNTSRGTVYVTLTDTTAPTSKTVTKSAVKNADGTTIDVTGIDASTLADGNIEISSYIVSPAGFESAKYTAPTKAVKDTVAPTLASLTATAGQTAATLVFSENVTNANLDDTTHLTATNGTTATTALATADAAGTDANIAITLGDAAAVGVETTITITPAGALLIKDAAGNPLNITAPALSSVSATPQ